MSSTVTTSGPTSQNTQTPSSEFLLPTLPEKPVVTIEPRSAWSTTNFQELWHYRELLYFLTWRDVKVRYKQTMLGVAWVIMQPVLTTIIFTIFLGRLARIPSDGLPYPLLIFAGLLPWTFFSTAVASATTSLVSNSNLITKIYFPRLIIPGGAIAGRLLDFVISFALLIGMMFYYRVPVGPKLFALPLLVLLTTLLSAAVGIWASALNVKYRDIGVAIPVLMQLWMFASPIVYPSSLVYATKISSTWKLLYSLNPVVGIVDNFRAALFGLPFNWTALWFSIGVTLVLMVIAAFEFRRMEKGFADVV